MIRYCERALNFLSVLRSINSETKLKLSRFSNIQKNITPSTAAVALNSCHTFSAQYTPEGTAKASAVDLLRLITLGGTKAAFLSPKRDHVPPRSFFI